MGQPITLGGTDGATLNLGNNDGYDSRGHWGGAGFVGGAILGGGAGYILSREVGDLKGRLGDVHAEIKESQASVEKEISGVTMNMKDQICGTEKLVSSETQRVTGLMGAGFDSMAQRFANQNDRLCGIEKTMMQMQNQTDRSVDTRSHQLSDCCCDLRTQLKELECCCERTQDKLDCMAKDIDNKFLITAKDNEIQRLKDVAYYNERFCKLEKGQEQILCILNNDRAIAEAKREAVEKFKPSQLYDKMMDTTSTASR